MADRFDSAELTGLDAYMTLPESALEPRTDVIYAIQDFGFNMSIPTHEQSPAHSFPKTDRGLGERGEVFEDR